MKAQFVKGHKLKQRVLTPADSKACRSSLPYFHYFLSHVSNCQLKGGWRRDSHAYVSFSLFSLIKSVHLLEVVHPISHDLFMPQRASVNQFARVCFIGFLLCCTYYLIHDCAKFHD